MEITKKKMSETDAWQRLTALCAGGEYCLSDMRRKMQRWEMPEGAEERIMARLTKERFVDETRFAHAFVRDRFRYNGWGARRIEAELKKKGISTDTINDALTEISEDNILESLCSLLESKRKSVRGKSAYEIRGKLIRFALSRGFSYDDTEKVLEKLNITGDEEKDNWEI